MSQQPWEVNSHFNNQPGGQVKLFDPNAGPPAEGVQQQHAQPQMYAPGYNNMSNGNSDGHNENPATQGSEGWDDSWNYSWDNPNPNQPQGENQDQYGAQPGGAQPGGAQPGGAQPGGAQPGGAQDWSQGQPHQQQWQPQDQYMPPPQGAYEQQPQNYVYEPQQYGNAIPMFHPEQSQQLQQPPPQQLPLQDIPLNDAVGSTEAASSGALSPPEAQPAAPQGSLTPASLSFNNLPHEPSPFDNLEPEPSGGMLQAPPPPAAATSQTHSRQSSFGNVQFIVGSENTSGAGTPERSMNTSTQDLPNEPKLDVPTEPSSPEEPLTPVIEAQRPPFPEVQRRPPSVQSTRSIDSIGHEVRSQLSSEPCSPLLASPPQHMPQGSPHRRGRQPSRQSHESASPGNRSLAGTASPMSSEARPSPGTAGVNIFAQPIQPSPTSPFQPPQHSVQPPPLTEQPQHFPEQPPIPQNQAPLTVEQPPAHAQEHPQPPPQHPPTSPDGPTPEDYKHSLSYQMHKHRHDQNMSPATTLWDNNPDFGKAPVLSPFAGPPQQSIHSPPAQVEASPVPVQSMVSPSLSHTSLPPPPTQAPVPPPPTNAAYPGAPSQTTRDQPPSRDDSRDSLSGEFRSDERRYGDHREAERNPRGRDGREEMPERDRQGRREMEENYPRQEPHGDAPLPRQDETGKADSKDGQSRDDPREQQDTRYKNQRDDRYKDPKDDRYGDQQDDRYKDPKDDRYRDQRDDRYKDPKDDRYRDQRDDRYKDPKDDRYKDPRDDRYRDNRDDRYRDPRDDHSRDRYIYDRRGRRADNSRGGHRRDDRYRPPSRSGSVHGDDPFDRPDRPHSRQAFDEYSDRPRSRQGREEDYRHPRRPHHDYDRPRSRQGFEYDDRPRSRQGFEDFDRPRSQQGFQDEDDYGRPRSRTGYEDQDGRRSRPTSRQGFPDDRRADSRSRTSRSEYDGRSRCESERDYYRQREHYSQYGRQPSGYGQKLFIDYYYGGYDYYQAGYYPPYQQQQDNYSKGYLEEMNSYYPGQGPPAQPPPPSAARSGDYLPGPGGSSGSRPSSLMGSQTDLDQHSQHSGVISRGSTPGFSDTGADHFARDSVSGSRPSSRASAYEPQPAYPPPQPMQPAYQHQAYAQYPAQAYYDPQTGYVYPGYEGQYGYDPNYQYPVKAEPEEPKRMTPAKFLMPHVCAKFGGASQLIQVAPNKPDEGEPALLNITELGQLLGQSRAAENLKKFPGPLVKGQTHKAEVTAFCRMKADDCRRNVDLRDRESAQLLWDYLALLVQQNGIVVGTDIAQLLLDGRPQEATSRQRLSSTRSNTASPPPHEKEEDTSHDRTVINRSNDVAAVNRFRELLLLGRKKDAIEWAMKSGLWGHALCLGSKMDAKTHASIMTRFTTTALKMTDPLQTLFQLMSHRQPASVTLVADVKWDDWRPHLAMILSNPTSRSDVDTKSIVTLGDTLASRGCLFASHFCYLMAQLPFGHFSQKSSKIVLIGSSHTLPLAEFASSTAIQCTEVYEYGRSLADPTFSLPAFHVLKYLYTVRLIDHGLTEEVFNLLFSSTFFIYGFKLQAFNYCEVLSQNIFLAPSLYNAPLVNGLLNLSCRLKYYDPERIQNGEGAADPYWLSQLQRVAAAFQDGTLQSQALPSFTPTLQPGRSSTTASSEVGEIMAPYAAQEQQQQPLQQPQQQQAFNSHQAQWGQQQHQQYDQQAAWDQYNQAQQQQQQPLAQQQQQQPEQAASEPPAPAPQWNTEQSQVDGSYLGYMPQQQHQSLHQPQQTQQPQEQPAAAEPIHIQPAPPKREPSPPAIHEPISNQRSDEVDYYKVASDPMLAQILDVVCEDEDDLSMSSLSTDFLDISCSLRRASPLVSHQRASPLSTPASSPRFAGLSPSSPSSHTKNVFQFGVPPPPLPNRRPPRAETPLGSTSSMAPPPALSSSLPPSTSKKDEPAKPAKKIIWDEATQSWKNTDGSDNDTQVSKAPPPTDSELLGGPPSGPPSTQGTPTQAPMPTPSSGSNRFSRQKTRGARGQYVDVFGSSAAKTPDAPSSLFNVLPKSQSMPAKLFVPAAKECENEEAAAALAAAEELAAAQPPMYMPTGQLNSQTFQPSVPEEESLSRCSSRSSMSMEVQRYMHQHPSNPDQPPVNQQAQAPPPEQQAPPPSMPMMFNPAQFSQAGGGRGGGAPGNAMGPPSTRNSMRLGQRRAYPK
ncbi:hypothetical protein CAPTEDRAFT_188765 [Capitella teleta]|uniref:Protein transport protein sec16 n=1 Tax=Capitella teleta TaxID=283909 RepID=R7TJ85_CAPTE|nr:hypothetical protein CAPTEDRAFT_188765 [Capitella teleta]|eukprot:ELT91611.1 hypothetical protein CAPTEDRAFT_188765 [Capitella teleta]